MANIKRANTSGITKSGAAISDVPDAPTIGAVSDPGTDGYASVAFTAATTGGAVTTYTATSTPGTLTGTSASSPITVTGLTVGTAYTFKVKGANSTATGPESSASSSFTPAFHPSGAYDSIATVTSTGSAGDITFTSIPATYKHLQIRGILRTSDTGSFNNQGMRFNSDTGSNYKSHTLRGDGTSATSGVVAGSTNFNDFMRAASNSLTAGIFSAIVMDILDYADTNKYKTFRALEGGDANGSGSIGLTSGVYMSTNAINSITISPSGGTAIQYSSFALYGIKGA